MVVLHVAQNCGNEQVQHWFRKNREERFGSTLEQFAGDNNQIIPAVKQALIPIHNVLKDYPYLTGDKGKLNNFTHTTMKNISSFSLFSWLGRYYTCRSFYHVGCYSFRYFSSRCLVCF
jgi:hypothetical protein